MRDARRSLCPISLSLEVFGDRWTLLIVRDLMFAGKRRFREFLQSDERISSRILADRLAALVEHGIITRSGDPSHKQKTIYSLTAKGVALLPIVAEIGAWGRAHTPTAGETAAEAERLAQGGKPLQRKLMAELVAAHGVAREPPANPRRSGRKPG
jgi:DNA-binding HxlR family transcriptional regulator